MGEAVICADCGVRDRALCGALSDRELTALNSIGRRRRLARGETFVWAGDENAVCANLLSGVLKLVAATPDGREQTVGLLFPADFIGDPYAGRSDHRVVALSEVELCVFPRAPFASVLDDHARMERLLLQRTLTGLARARDRMLMLARLSADERVAAFLVDMADRATAAGCSARISDGAPATFDLPLSRGDIADVLGLTIETVSRTMTRLRDEGLIALPGRRTVTIRDRSALVERAKMLA